MPLISRNFPFSPRLQDGCCHCPFFEDGEKILRGYRTPSRSHPGYQSKDESIRSLSWWHFSHCIRNHCSCSPIFGKPPSPTYSRVSGPNCHNAVILHGLHKGAWAGVVLTWRVEQAGPLAVVGHLLFTVLRAVNHGLQLLQAASVVQGHGVGLLSVGTSHMGQLRVVVLHQCPDLVLCPENTTKEGQKRIMLIDLQKAGKKKKKTIMLAV